MTPPSTPAPRLRNPFELQDHPECYLIDVHLRNHHDHWVLEPIINSLHLELMTKLRREDNYSGRLHFATTGSDGRWEKKGVETSPLEAIVLMDPVQEKVASTIEKNLLDASINNKKIFGAVEVKFLAPELLPYFRNNAEKLESSWPTRMFDARSLDSRSSYVLTEAKTLMSQAIVDPIHGKNMHYRLRKNLIQYRSICQKNGKGRFAGRDLAHFDVEEGMMYFDRDGLIQTGSVKFGPLRAIQLFLAYKFVKALRETQLPAEDMAHHLVSLPTDIRGKLSYLSTTPVNPETTAVFLPMEAGDIQRMAELYRYFLFHYYLSEYAYAEEAKTAVQIPNLAEFSENLRDITTLLRLD